MDLFEDNAKHTRNNFMDEIVKENLKAVKETHAFFTQRKFQFIFLASKILLISYGNNSFHHQKMN